MGLRSFFGKARRERAGTLLGRLRNDKRGNVLAIMAAALIPFCGLVGGGIDLSRMYITKTRLQHACDAGALAGRKRMGAGTWTANTNAANVAAVQFFDANFSSGGMYGATDLTKSFAESAGKVTGTASATVPMTLMRVLGKTQETLTVVCDAEMRLPNTDIMFVLDTTGSMEDKAINTDTQTKIVALKSAVKCFYEIVARLDTTENCTTGAPSGGVGNQVQVRFGFVPYATNVNVGRLLPTGWFADSWDYQTRKAKYSPSTSVQTGQTQLVRASGANPDQNYPWIDYPPSYANVSSATCTANKPPKTSPGTPIAAESGPYDQTSSTSGNTTTYNWKTRQRHSEYDFRANYNSSTKNCVIQRRYQEFDVIREYRRGDTAVTTDVFSGWRYWKLPVVISGLKNGTAWNTSFQLPIGNTATGAATAAMKTINWDGCIEERKTIRATSYTSATGGAAKDLDIDTVPKAGDSESLWGPALHDVIYLRGSTRTTIDDNDVSTFNLSEQNNNENYATIDGNNQDSYFCPSQAHKLAEWTSVSTFEGYVDGLTTGGNTYHDIGLLWGARFASPTGIFASENALTPLGGTIDRNLIFMTDGETCTASYNYGPYGFPWYDRRQTDEALAPTGRCETETDAGGTLSEQVNARYAALCSAVKNKNITLWVIWFGVSKPNLEARLTTCATSGRFYAARNAAALQTTFASIANQISQLRLTR